MRFTSLHIEAFGRLRDWRVDDLHPGLVVVLGPNEAGKSTLFRFLTAMLYGIYPANPETNPYVPWDGGVLAGSARLALADGTVLHVHRRLLSQPRGVLEYIGTGDPSSAPAGADPSAPETVVRQEELRNREVPGVAHVSQKVFEDVFALTLEEMRFPAGDAWSLIQERLLGNLGSDFFRPLPKVLEELQSEADRLWRPDRRGKQRDKELVQRLGELREQRREARERDRETREIYARLAELAAQRERLRNREVELDAQLRRAARLAPVRRTLQRIAELQAAAGDLKTWDHLPDDPLAALAELDEALVTWERRLGELDEEIDRCRGPIDAVGEADRELLAREGELMEAVHKLARRDHLLAQEEQLARREESLRRQLAERSRDLLAAPWEDRWEETFAAFSLAELRAALQRYRDADAGYQQARARTLALQAQEAVPAEGGSLRWATVIMAFGLSLALIGGSGVIDVLLWAGLLLMLVGALQGWNAWQQRKRRRRERVQRRRLEAQYAAAENEAARERDAALREIEQGLGALPVHPSRLESPDDSLLVDIQHIQALVHSLHSLRGEREALREAMEPIVRELQAVVEQVAAVGSAENTAPGTLAAEPSTGESWTQGVPAGDSPTARGAPHDEDDLARHVRRLPARLAAARERVQAARTSKELLARLTAERDRHVVRGQALREERSRLLAALAPLAPGSSVAEQAALLRRRREAARDARALEENLRRQHPDLESLKAQIAAEEEREGGWDLTDERIARLEKDLADIRGELEACGSEAVRLREQLARLEALPTVDHVEGEIEAVEEERRAVRRQRDRLALLIRVLQEADRRFRDEHQPDVLRRAGEYLQLISGGRYVKLFVEQLPSGLRATVREAHDPYPRDLTSPLSRGTLDQVYLALRLAIIDHLDANQEPLPLFLDEVLVNWDRFRRHNVFRLLERITARRQVFLFTCHRWLADELTASLPAQQIALPGPR